MIADGRIAETGEHQDLITAGGLYAELYVREFENEISSASPNGNGFRSQGADGDEPEYVTVAQGEPESRRGE